MGLSPGKSSAEDLFPVRILNPAGELVFEERVPGDRTLSSVLRALRPRTPGGWSLLRDTEVVHRGTRVSELNLADTECLCLVGTRTGSYTFRSQSDDDFFRPDVCATCVLLGDARTGKTSFLQAFFWRSFSDEYKPTIGVDFMPLCVRAEDGTSLRIQLVDMNGQPRFRPYTRGYLREASGLLAFFSLTSRASFNEVLTMLQQVERDHPRSCQCVCLVATHADLPCPEVTETEAEQLAKEKQWPFFAISNKNPTDNFGVGDPLFAWLDLLVYDFHMQRES